MRREQHPLSEGLLSGARQVVDLNLPRFGLGGKLSNFRFSGFQLFRCDLVQQVWLLDAELVK